jgi:Ca2+-binding EF-hand superfamily protein
MKKHSVFLIASISMSLVTGSVLADPGHHRKSRFMSFFDSNNDNIVTMDELNEAAKSRFSKMDTDGNGTVTMNEFRAYVDQRKEEQREARFKKLDTNSDGQISKDEYLSYKQQKAEQHFQAKDTNNDGLISQDEFGDRKHGAYCKKHGNKHGHYGGKHGHHKGARFFSKLDSNNDGQVTLEESQTAWTNWFKRIDANNDQVVTLDEVKNFRKSMWNK